MTKTKYFLLAIVSAVLFAGLSAIPGISSSDRELALLPENLITCLPKPIANIQIEGQVHQQNQTYYVIYASSQPDEHDVVGKYVLQLDRAGCLNLSPIEEAKSLAYKSLDEFVPPDIANQIALQKWEKRLQKFSSLKALEQDIRQGLQPGPYRIYLFREDVWALNQMGIPISEKELENQFDGIE